MDDLKELYERVKAETISPTPNHIKVPDYIIKQAKYEIETVAKILIEKKIKREVKESDFEYVKFIRHTIVRPSRINVIFNDIPCGVIDVGDLCRFITLPDLFPIFNNLELTEFVAINSR